jgi:uncharacterized protein (DUF2141 family)
MRPYQLLVVVLLLTVLACAARTPKITDEPTPSTSGPATVTVTVLGLKSEDGAVALALFASAEDFKTRSNAVATGRVPPNDGTAVWQVENLQPGTYALAVYHDLNGNGELDRSTLGPPAEPYGFSNDARGTFGPPKFAKAAFEIGPTNRAIEIKLR